MKDDLALIRILAKRGFKKHKEDMVFANARGEEVEEFVFKLVYGLLSF